MHVTFCGWPGERNFPDNLKTYYSKRNANRCRPAELLMNRRLRTRLDIPRPEIQKRVAKPAKLQPTVSKIQGVWEILLLYKITGSVKIPGQRCCISMLGPLIYCVRVKEVMLFGSILINQRTYKEPKFSLRFKGKLRRL